MGLTKERVVYDVHCNILAREHSAQAKSTQAHSAQAHLVLAVEL